MEMNDNHIEYHTVGEFLEFCVNGPDSAKAGNWMSTFPGARVALICAFAASAHAAIELTPENFDKEVVSSGKSAFIKFLAPW